ncbi:Polynucleotidyl transferase- ribonuclease H-like superfamily protein [Striga hermonthica]|uniref:Polynucleotidyl transferase- ribonuclease H-like superfamily protein n=1 Tax=Striga hermonthica TaxID=68872 RepID=A0A9N7NLV6_STRHE|nr:Polynucleotidyl transferase- ribonuclease H-like superfamily protein [Striga hermonthica]
MVRWTAPVAGWVKVNVDGSVTRTTSLSSAGRLIRDETGCWIVGFAMNIGTSTVLEAELWGVIQGLKLAWDRGFRLVELEVDNLSVTNLISRLDGEVSFHRQMVQVIRDLLARA